MRLLRIVRAWVFKRKMKFVFSTFKKFDRIYLRHLPKWKRDQFLEDWVRRETFRNVTFDNIPGLEWMRKRYVGTK